MFRLVRWLFSDNHLRKRGVMHTQFVNVRVTNLDAPASEPDRYYSLPTVPQKGDAIVIQCADNPGSYKEIYVTDIAHIARSASPSPLESYIHVFVEDEYHHSHRVNVASATVTELQRAAYVTKLTIGDIVEQACRMWLQVYHTTNPDKSVSEEEDDE